MRNFKYIFWFFGSFLLFLPTALALDYSIYEVSWDKANVGVFSSDTTYYSMDYNGWEVVSSDGGIYYCIEPEVYMPLKGEVSDTNHEIVSFNEYLKLVNVSKEKLDKVKLLAYYGYMYPGHTKKKWYGITQVMIWKTIRPDINYVYKTGRYGVLDKNLYKDEEKELELLIKNHKILPSFANESIKVSYDDEIVLEDTNKVLNGFSIKGDNNVYIKDNKLYIKPSSFDDLNFNFYKEKVNNSVYFYHSYDYQNVLKRGDVDVLDFNLKVSFNDYKIKLIKKDYDTKEPLSNVLYALYDKEKKLIDEKVSDSNGVLLFEHLKKDIYYVKEVKELDNYVKDEAIYKIVLDEQLKSLELFNKRKKGVLKVSKIDSSTNELLDGAKFEVYDESNKKVLDITSASKELEFDLLEGRYYLIEKEAPKDYKKTDEKFFFDIVYNEDSVLKIKNTFLEENPNTFDNLFFYIFGFIISFVFVLILVFNFKKNQSYD